MKTLDLTAGARKVAQAARTAVAAVGRAVAGEAQAPHRCDGFHCDCQRRREVNTQARQGDWLPSRGGWLKRERE